MPRLPSLRIIEIFPSVQGEGTRQGEATIFIRLADCKLRCSFCDTKYAWGEGRVYTIRKILDRIHAIRSRFPAGWVCLTGGEPLLQDVGNLVRMLKKEKLKVQVETNATVFQPLPVDWWTVSPKPAKYSIAPEFRQKADEVKLVVTKDLTLAVLKKMRRAFPEQIPILLQPQSGRIWSMKKALKLQRQSLPAGLQNIRVSLQLHKIFRIP